jgi:RNA polymerase sigma-54 factor
MKPSLQFRLSQHLTLTPQLQQSIRLLQLSTVELNQEIDRLLIENPILEREESDAGNDTAHAVPDGTSTVTAAGGPAASEAADWPVDVAATWRGSEDDEENDRAFAAPDTPTLRDHLRSQLTLTNLGERDRVIVELLIDALDEDGYLTQALEEIAALLPEEAEVNLEELGIALRHLQNMEPAGVGARAPGECLALQLRAIREPDPARPLALEIAEKHLELLATRDYTRLKAATGASEEELREAQRLIRALNPRPGAAFARVEARYVVPDVIVRKLRNVWRASLNPEAMPKLRINRLYAELAAGARSSGNALSSQLQEAR